MAEKQKHSLVKSGLRLSFVTLLSRILGLVREMTKAAFLGTGSYADAFGIAFQLPNLFRRLFAENSISVAFIPTFRSYIEDIHTEEDKRGTQDFISATLTLVTFLTTLVVLLGIIFTPLLIKLFYGSADAATVPEAVFLTRIMFPYLIVVSIAAFFQGILNGVDIFTPSGFAPVLFNMIVITATYVLAPHMANPARAMAVGVMAGGCVQALFQLPFVFKTKWHISFTSLKKAFTNPGTIKVITLILPTIVGMAAYQVNDLVSSTLAKRAGIGIYSSLQYSLRLQELILGIFAVSIGSVILPDMSGLAKKKQWDEFSGMLVRAIQIITLISIPVTFYSLITGREIISLIYKSRNFTEESVQMTLSVFRFHMAGLVFIAINRILSPAYYAQSNTTLPTAGGLLNFGVNIALAAVLVHPMSGSGIALALSVASFANTVFLFAAMPRTHSVNTKKIVTSFISYAAKITAFSLIASVPTYILRPFIIRLFSGHNRLISDGMPVVLTACIFAVTGAVLLIVTRDPIAQTVTGKLSRRIKK
ncbi:MAG: murein biosynthesis integral membrane protein MurJ [Treponema sp.]|nr:murein biosynthesis integral membrane protein MurJ [Treponema sp.]